MVIIVYPSNMYAHMIHKTQSAHTSQKQDGRLYTIYTHIYIYIYREIYIQKHTYIIYIYIYINNGAKQGILGDV